MDLLLVRAQDVSQGQSVVTGLAGALRSGQPSHSPSTLPGTA
ncbi:hypothetical protein [Actinoallomurus iriomotensis]|nr:hypothetical protein [Actinoallomurus iriomotensis]